MRDGGDESVNPDQTSKTAKDVIDLVSCAVNLSVPEPARIEAMDLPAVFSFAEQHMLSAAVAMALEAAGCGDSRSGGTVAATTRRAAIFDQDQKAILQKLEEAGIWYMPLKGAVLKDLYPKYGMREMTDRDILFDAERAPEVRTIMEELGFRTEEYDWGPHDDYVKPPVSHFEMHRALFTEVHDGKLYDYYRNVRERLIKDEDNGFGYHFGDEDFYLFMLAHEYKHYMAGGTGLRSLLDIYVFCLNKGDTLDWAYITAELKKLGIADFEKKNRDLAKRVFGKESQTEADHEMLSYMIDSGTHGSREHEVENWVSRMGGGFSGKLKYLQDRIFMSGKELESSYPFFAKHRVLLPALVVYRIGRGLTVKREQVKADLKALMKHKTGR